MAHMWMQHYLVHLRINGNTSIGPHSISFRIGVMRKCDEWQLTFKSGAYLIRNGYGALALSDFAQRKYLTRSSQKWMNVKQSIQFSVRETQYCIYFVFIDMLQSQWKIPNTNLSLCVKIYLVLSLGKTSGFKINKIIKRRTELCQSNKPKIFLQ